jgi:hypothetical protein
MATKAPKPRRCTIRASACYSRDEMIHRLGICTATWRALKRKGLKTTTIGQLEFCLGEDWIAFVRASRRDNKSARGN